MAQGVKAGNAYIQLAITGGEKLKQGLMKARSAMNSLGSSALKLGTNLAKIGAASGIASVTAAVTKFAAAGDAMDKMALRTGIAAKELSTLKFALEQSGSSIEDLDRGMKRLAESDDFAGTPLERLKQAADEIASYDDAMQQAARANELFGRAGYDMLPFLKQGASGMEALQEQADALGLTIDQDMATSGANLTDTFNKLKQTVGAAFVQIGAQLAPFVEKMAEGATMFLVSWRSALAKVQLAFAETWRDVRRNYESYGDFWARLFGQEQGNDSRQRRNQRADEDANIARLEKRLTEAQIADAERRRRIKEALDQRNDIPAVVGEQIAEEVTEASKIAVEAIKQVAEQGPSISNTSSGGFGGFIKAGGSIASRQLAVAQEQLSQQKELLEYVKSKNLTFAV